MALERKARDKYNIGDLEKGETYCLKICDHILDSIYGQIGLTSVEKQIEKLAVFKRLHSISQLGLVNWIFPCALHTRYTHSIGVMHIAGQMAEHINQNMGERYSQPFFDDNDIQIIRLAGMLHDIGHYPLSHNIEQVYKDAQKKKECEGTEILDNLEYYINCPIYLHPQYINRDDYPKEKNDFNKKFCGSQGLHHENVGKMIVCNNKDIKNAIKWNFVLLPSANKDEWVLNPKFSKKKTGVVSDSEVEEIIRNLLLDIGNMIIGNYQESDGSNAWNEKYSAMVQIIHSELDADNLDYLLRDATFSGTSYGIMDMSLLLNCLTVGTLTFEDCSNKVTRYILGVKKKGLGCVEQFLLNKFLAYTQMILSKYTSILEAMLLRFELETADSTDNDYNYEQIENLATNQDTTLKFLKFSDYYIFDEIFDAGKHWTSMADFPKAAVSRLRHSCAFDLVDDNSQCICTGTDISEMQEEMRNSKVYMRFSALCDRMDGKFGADLRSSGNTLEKELLSFRFEQYSLTKQIPLVTFMEDLVDVNYPSKRNDQHYFRLATGVPILCDAEEYTYNGSTELSECQKMLPELCVDSAQSSLHNIYNMKYVSLRQYKIAEYEIS